MRFHLVTQVEVVGHRFVALRLARVVERLDGQGVGARSVLRFPLGFLPIPLLDRIVILGLGLRRPGIGCVEVLFADLRVGLCRGEAVRVGIQCLGCFAKAVGSLGPAVWFGRRPVPPSRRCSPT